MAGPSPNVAVLFTSLFEYSIHESEYCTIYRHFARFGVSLNRPIRTPSAAPEASSDSARVGGDLVRKSLLSNLCFTWEHEKGKCRISCGAASESVQSEKLSMNLMANRIHDDR